MNHMFADIALKREILHAQTPNPNNPSHPPVFSWARKDFARSASVCRWAAASHKLLFNDICLGCGVRVSGLGP